MPPTQGAKVTPLKETISRYKQAWDIITGRSFSPGLPMELDTNKEEQTGGPRLFDYPMGSNLQVKPRSEYSELTPFEQLRSLARLYDVASLCIATRIEQMTGLDWSIKVRDKYKDKAAGLEGSLLTVTEFWESPDRRNDFSTWLSLALRDILEIDALSIYPQKDSIGRLTKLEIVDGATIKILLDDRGRDAAYQQIVKGFPASDYHRYKLDPAERLPLETDLELIYKPRYQRTDTPYGYSPVEQVLMRVNMALRKQTYDMAYFTDGNIPEMLISPPADKLTAEQVRTFEEYFNALMAGDDSARRKIKMIPWPANATMLKSFSYDTILDEWMMKITCAAFGVTPNELGFTDDVNRATASSQQDVTYRKGIKPLAKWLKGFFDGIIKDLGYPQLEWDWQFDEAEDTLSAAQEDDIYIKNGTISPDEIRSIRFGGKLTGKAPGPPPPPGTGQQTVPPFSSTTGDTESNTNGDTNGDTKGDETGVPPNIVDTTTNSSQERQDRAE